MAGLNERLRYTTILLLVLKLVFVLVLKVHNDFAVSISIEVALKLVLVLVLKVHNDFAVN